MQYSILPQKVLKYFQIFYQRLLHQVIYGTAIPPKILYTPTIEKHHNIKEMRYRKRKVIMKEEKVGYQFQWLQFTCQIFDLFLKQLPHHLTILDLLFADFFYITCHQIPPVTLEVLRQ